MNFSAALRQDDDVVDTGFVPATLSLEAVKPDFMRYIDQVDKMVLDANTIVITNDEQLKFAVALGGEAKKITKIIDAKKKEVTAEASDFVKSVNGFCKIFTDKLDDVESSVKKKISDYQYRLEVERRKQEEEAKKAAADLQAKLNAEAKQAGVEAPIVHAPVIPVQKSVTRTETGTSSYQVKRWICTIEDADKVPRLYCEPSKKLLDEAVKHGVREIPGCKIEEKTETRFRT